MHFSCSKIKIDLKSSIFDKFSYFMVPPFMNLQEFSSMKVINQHCRLHDSAEKSELSCCQGTTIIQKFSTDPVTMLPESNKK